MPHFAVNEVVAVPWKIGKVPPEFTERRQATPFDMCPVVFILLPDIEENAIKALLEDSVGGGCIDLLKLSRCGTGFPVS